MALAHFERVCRDFDQYMRRKDTWYRKTLGAESGLIAHFSAESRLTEIWASMPGPGSSCW
jgi:hypothetical protein